MAVYKCKMCGGALEIGENMTVCRCSYCGTEQTLPKLDNETRNRLFDRANYYRRSSDFDRAAAVYEDILSEAPQEAEAHWGLCLCNYGIEYVRDPRSGKMLPTCHRTQFRSILEDSSFLLALKYSDGAAQSLYRHEAAYIDKVQKRILSISGQESPFDIFICYKETESYGERTAASVEAQEIYDELTERGYKVFFSRITLEDKLGQEYEPYIFAALQSAEVMLVVGNKPDQFTSVWVKNEWSRFLSLMSQGQHKYIIPCYKDMNPYDLPEELISFQAQDLSKMGAVQDLVRGVEKLIGGGHANTAVSAANPDSLLDRAYLFLEDKDWKNADVYCEKALDADPRNSKAYLGKLLASLKKSSVKELSALNIKISKYDNFQKALRFADSSEKKALEELDIQCRLNRAAESIDNCYFPSDAEKLISDLKELGNFGNAAALITAAERKRDELRQNSIMDAERMIDPTRKGKDILAGLKLLDEVKDMPEAEILREKAVGMLESHYQKACAAMESGDNKKAVEYFRWLDNYKDSLRKGIECEEKLQKQLTAERIAAEEEERLRMEAEAIERSRQLQATLKSKSKSRVTFTIVFVLIAIFSAMTVLRCYSIAWEHEMVMAENYRLKTLIASPLFCFAMIYMQMRHDGSLSQNSLFAFRPIAVLIAVLTTFFMNQAGYNAILLLMVIALHVGAMIAAYRFGSIAHKYYYGENNNNL